MGYTGLVSDGALSGHNVVKHSKQGETIKRLFLTLLATTATTVFAQTDTPTAILPDASPWQGNPSVPGAESKWMLGAADGRVICPTRETRDARIAPHTHGDERFSVVLEGSSCVGFGESFDPEKVLEIPQGAMYVAPAGVVHYVWAKDGAAVYQSSGMGQTETSFISRP